MLGSDQEVVVEPWVALVKENKQKQQKQNARATRCQPLDNAPAVQHHFTSHQLAYHIVN